MKAISTPAEAETNEVPTSSETPKDENGGNE
jgi:hypothetical protein